MNGESGGSITVINAMPAGIGSTVGTTLGTRASFSESGSERRVEIRNDPNEDPTMARICVRRAYEKAGIPEPDAWTLTTDSEIPVSRGLKSSSSACNAILKAVFGEIGFSLDTVDMIRLGVECAKEAGVTITGSFDDACGCELGGLVLTDNRTNGIIFEGNVDVLDVVIRVPRTKIRKSSLPIDELRKHADEMRPLISMVAKNPFRAMTLNGEIIARIQNLDNSLSERAMKMGALGAGISGSGPAIAMVVPSGDGKSFARDMELDPKETIFTKTRRGRV